MRRHKKTEERKRGVKINVLGRNRKPETWLQKEEWGKGELESNCEIVVWRR